MKNQMLNLGILLSAILLIISVGSLALFFTNDTNNLFGIALAIILLLVAMTFVSYLLFDLYSAKQDDLESDCRSSKETIK